VFRDGGGGGATADEPGRADGSGHTFSLLMMIASGIVLIMSVVGFVLYVRRLPSSPISSISPRSCRSRSLRVAQDDSTHDDTEAAQEPVEQNKGLREMIQTTLRKGQQTRKTKKGGKAGILGDSTDSLSEDEEEVNDLVWSASKERPKPLQKPKKGRVHVDL